MRPFATTLLVVIILALSLREAGTTTSSQSTLGLETTVGTDSCLVQLTGDVNIDGMITAADIIYLIRDVFLSGPPSQPCRAAADVNCTGRITSGDIIYLVNYVFKGGPAPCDVCTLIPEIHPCP